MWAWENPGAQCGARQSTGKTQASCALSAEGRPHSSTSPGDAARRIRCLLSALRRDDEKDISKGFCGRRAPTAGTGRTISEGGRDPRLSRLMPEMSRSRSPGGRQPRPLAAPHTTLPSLACRGSPRVLRRLPSQTHRPVSAGHTEAFSRHAAAGLPPLPQLHLSPTTRAHVRGAFPKSGARGPAVFREEPHLGQAGCALDPCRFRERGPPTLRT